MTQMSIGTLGDHILEAFIHIGTAYVDIRICLFNCERQIGYFFNV